MWFGRPVLASETSSLPEVGGDLVDYCDPYDDRRIKEKLTRLLFDDAHRRERAEAIGKAKLRAWKDVVFDMSIALGK
jgi:glycosyltransferase involved in cell wall biosynthesis